MEVSPAALTLASKILRAFRTVWLANAFCANLPRGFLSSNRVPACWLLTNLSVKKPAARVLFEDGLVGQCQVVL